VMDLLHFYAFNLGINYYKKYDYLLMKKQSGRGIIENNIKYKLTIYDNYYNKVVVNCEFTCEDLNNDGLIDINELIEFKESVPHLFRKLDKSQTDGWRSEVDVKNMPEIINRIQDIDLFRFNIDEYKKGNVIIKYKTNTKEDLVVGNYLFMRLVNIENNGEEITVLSWVSDETRGLEMIELNPENLTLKIDRL